MMFTVREGRSCYTLSCFYAVCSAAETAVAALSAELVRFAERLARVDRFVERVQLINSSVLTFSAKVLMRVWFFDNQPMRIGIDLCQRFD